MGALERLVSGVERASAVDRLGGPIHGLAKRAMPTGAKGDALTGRWLGHPVHPFLVTAPIGCWTGASLLDVFGQRRAAQTLVGAGVICAVPTAMTGLADWTDTAGAEQRVGLLHLAVNLAATGLYGASWLARRRARPAAGVGLAVAGAAVATTAGWLGGHLAYSLGVGVDTNAFDGGPTEWTPLDQCGGDSDLTSAAAGGVSVVVASVDGSTRVLANRCSHRGGPLSDGTCRRRLRDVPVAREQLRPDQRRGAPRARRGWPGDL